MSNQSRVMYTTNGDNGFSTVSRPSIPRFCPWLPKRGTAPAHIPCGHPSTPKAQLSGVPLHPVYQWLFVAGQDRDGGARWPLNVSGECCRKHVPTCVVNGSTLAKSPSCGPAVMLPRLSSGRPCGSRQDRMSWPEPSVCAGPIPSPLQGRAAAIPPSFRQYFPSPRGLCNEHADVMFFLPSQKNKTPNSCIPLQHTS